MTQSPFMAFAALNEALTRLTALLVMIADHPEIDGALVAEKYIAAAVEAHAALVRDGDVIEQIGAFLLTISEGRSR